MPQSSASRLSAAGQAFLAVYPRAADPLPVALAWNGLELDAGADLVMAALDAWKRSPEWIRDGGQYVPSAARILRSRYFERAPARVSGNALHAVTVSKPDAMDWRLLEFPGGVYFVADDTVVLDRDLPSAQALVSRYRQLIGCTHGAGVNDFMDPVCEPDLPASPPTKRNHCEPVCSQTRRAAALGGARGSPAEGGRSHGCGGSKQGDT